MAKKTVGEILGGPVAIRVYVCILALGLGIGISLLGIVPILKMNCVWFDKQCSTIQYQVGPQNMLLVKDKRSGFTYFYDGFENIYSYGDNLSGSCPTQTYTGTLGINEPIGDPIAADDACLTVDTDGNCTTTYSDPVCATVDVETGECTNWETPTDPNYTPSQMSGEQVGSGGTNLFIPAFAVNAATMQLRNDKYCVRPLSQLPAELLDAPTQEFQYTNPNNSLINITIYQVFDLLEKEGIFKRPSNS